MWLLQVFVLSLCCTTTITSAAESPCPTDPNLMGYSNKTILNEDIINRTAPDDGTVTTYTICPDTTFRFTREDGQSVYLHGPNLVLQCGQDGSSQNNCVLETAESGVSTMLVAFGNNTVVSGLTMRDAQDATIDYRSGVVSAYNTTVFRDCHFQNLNAYGAVQPLINVGTLIPLQEPPDLQKSVQFEDCVWNNNTGWSRIMSITQDETHKYDVAFNNAVFDRTGIPSYGRSMIAMEGIGGSLTVIDSVFRCIGSAESNAQAQSILGVRESDVRVENSCFVETNIEEAFVTAFGDPDVANTNNRYVRAFTPRCGGIKVTTFGDGKTTETCLDFESSDSCPLEGQDASVCPTPPPTTPPTPMPSPSPTSGGHNSWIGLTRVDAIMLATTVLVAISG